MRILAIDPGTHCGYAYTDSGKVEPCQSGVWNLKTSRFDSGGMRFIRLRDFIAEIAPDIIYYEEVHGHKGTDAAHIYGGLIGVIQTYGEDHHIEYAGIPVGTIKRHATGKGNADKQAMCEAACRRFGFASIDDNRADALWILDCVENGK